MFLTLVTPRKKLLVDQEVTEVVLPANKGELSIYEGHSPLVTTLGIGALKIKTKDEGEKVFAISWGYLEVIGEKITVLAEVAQTPESLDREKIKSHLNEVQGKLQDKDLSIQQRENLLHEVQKDENELSMCQ